MSKEMISIPAGNLLSVAATKGITTLSALKEKTGVDRKTLRAINAGQPVKTTTLQSIADKLRVPISHLLASNAADNNEVAEGIGEFNERSKTRELKLQQLDGAALRKLAGETTEITWSLDIDQLPEELEATLLKLQKTLRDWYAHLCIGPEDQDNLLDEIRYIKNSADFDKSIEELARHKLKMYGATYIGWEARYPCRGDRRLPILVYQSSRRAALSVVPDTKTNPIARVRMDDEPPRTFIESEIPDIELVFIDGTKVWSRETVSDELFGYLPDPF